MEPSLIPEEGKEAIKQKLPDVYEVLMTEVPSSHTPAGLELQDKIKRLYSSCFNFVLNIQIDAVMLTNHPLPEQVDVI